MVQLEQLRVVITTRDSCEIMVTSIGFSFALRQIFASLRSDFLRYFPLLRHKLIILEIYNLLVYLCEIYFE